MINSFDNVDTEKLNNRINNYKEVLANSSKRDYIGEITNGSVLDNDAKEYFVKSFKEINDMKENLNKSLDVYRKLVEVVKQQKIESETLKKLIERKKILENDIANDNTYELTQLNNEIDLHNSKINNLNSEIENLSNQI
ncbi:MAG: hypothetical protein MR550_03905 [Bacilli bacterium]|nr:hypothetical protein [Bacilli bacterium]